MTRFVEQGFDILGAFENGGKHWFATKKEAENAVALGERCERSEYRRE